MCPQMLWDAAVEHHLAGKFAEAESLYRQLLDQTPANAPALHMLGMLQFQRGDARGGLVLVDRAIAIDAQVAKYHGHRGLLLAETGNLDEAIRAYRRALSIEPHPDVLHNLGNALRAKNDFAGAAAAYRTSLAAQPSAMAEMSLGSVLTQSGDYTGAVDAFDRALQLQPGNPVAMDLLAKAYNNRAAVLEQEGQSAQAIACCDRALTLVPDFAAPNFNRGKALASLARFDEAILAYQRAITLQPEFADAHNNLGIALFARGRLQEAVASYRQALAHQPAHAQACNNLASALRAGGRLTEAVAAYRRALELAPDDAEVWNNLGTALDCQGDFDEALIAFQRALAIRPRFSQAENNLGNAFKNLGDLDAALAAYQRAIEIQPDNQDAQSNRLYTMYFHADYSAERIYLEHRQWSATWAEPLRRPSHFTEIDRSADRRLRVGYVAAAFRDHCQAFFIQPLWSQHDRKQVEVFAYSDVTAPDAVTALLRSRCDGWRNIAGLTDDSVAEQIRQDRIDILVDLSLHMSQNRLLVMARKPAPVQVTWLGYPGTTGLDSIDYRLTDPYLDPPAGENDRYYSEKSYRLPQTFWCYDPLTSEPAVNGLPALGNGHVTFGCLNNFCKVNADTLRLWARVMREMPESRLLLLAPRAAQTRVLRTLGAEGIGSDRIEFVERASRQKYLAFYHRIDVGLDTFPYNGHTTTLDSFWMGVPVVTMIGRSPAGRAGWSQLNNLSLQQLAAKSENDFIRIAVEIGSNTRQLAEIRKSLRQRLIGSPLCAGQRFAQNIESAYRAMWREFTRR